MTTITDGNATFAVEYRKATFHGMIMSFSGSFSSDGYPIDSATGVVRKRNKWWRNSHSVY